MAQIPLFVLIVLGVIPVVAAMLLTVEAKVVRPAIEEERLSRDEARL